VNAAAPSNVNKPTRPTSAVCNASSISSKDTDPISRPAPRAMTNAMSFGLGVDRKATRAPMRRADAANAPQKNASSTAES
jgi:hypothetical protein